MTKLRILIIENSVAVTGALKAILNAANNLKADFDFRFVIPKNAQTKMLIESAGFPVEQWRLVELSKKLWPLIVYLPQLLINAFKLKRTVKRMEIDLVHVNDLYNLIPAAAVCVGMRVRYVSHVRFLPNRFPKMLFSVWMKIQLRFAQQVIAVSQTLKNSLPEHPKITMIYDGLPVSNQVPPMADKEPAFTFLYLSNFIEGKGQHYALEAFERIHTKIPEWKLRFVGGDMGQKKNRLYLQELQAHAQKAGLSEKVEWAGFTDRVETEYRSADIVINFSDSESFSMTCAEALYYGVPTLASDSGGPAEIIDHSLTGWLVPNKNVAAMSEAMLKLAQDSNLRETMSRHAAASVRRKFSPENTAARLGELYRLSLQK